MLLNHVHVTQVKTLAVDETLRRIHRNSLVLLLVLVLAGAIWKGWGMAVSVLLGGLLAGLNFRWLSKWVDHMVGQAAAKSSSAGVMAKFLGRLLLIFLVFFAIIHISFLSVTGALAGFSVFILAVMWEAVVAGIRIR
ncbi:MAG: ATP synthase subunit I [Acidobacteria bacterium]|nr:ATP synthase subunit I [Acidobacteriota bacterium]